MPTMPGGTGQDGEPLIMFALLARPKTQQIKPFNKHKQKSNLLPTCLPKSRELSQSQESFEVPSSPPHVRVHPDTFHLPRRCVGKTFPHLSSAS